MIVIEPTNGKTPGVNVKVHIIAPTPEVMERLDGLDNVVLTYDVSYQMPEQLAAVVAEDKVDVVLRDAATDLLRGFGPSLLDHQVRQHQEAAQRASEGHTEANEANTDGVDDEEGSDCR